MKVSQLSRVAATLLLGAICFVTILALKGTFSYPTSTTLTWEPYFKKNLLRFLPETDGFDLPLNPPDGHGALLVEPFMSHDSLSEIWQMAPGVKEAAVHASAEGWVSMAMNLEGDWGCVVILTHRLPSGAEFSALETMYAGMESLSVTQGQLVKRGEKIGVLRKTESGQTPQLRWEVRSQIGLLLGPEIWDETSDGKGEGWLCPSDFVREHRPATRGKPIPPKA